MEPNIKELNDRLAKIAKSLFFEKVARDIREARKEKRPMHSKSELIREYRRYLDRFNRKAQKLNITYGFLLYAHVATSRYWWMNALNPTQINSKSFVEVWKQFVVFMDIQPIFANNIDVQIAWINQEVNKYKD